MKQIFLMITAISMLLKSQPSNSNQQFESQRVSKTASINLNGNIDKVFSLFGAFEERKWADHWNPILIYPSVEQIKEGTAFKTEGHGHGEQEFRWVVTKYQFEGHLVQYLVSTENRYWTITVKCRQLTDHITTAEITYIYTGLNALGNQINSLAIQSIYKQNLKDWEKAINYYLETGKTLIE